MPREVFSIICDDIRYERGNKISLMGIYTGGIVVARLPLTLIKLCLFQHIEDARDVKTIRIEIRGPKLHQKLEVASDDPSKSKLRISVTFGAVHLQEEGDYRIETYLDASKTPVVTKTFDVKVQPDLKLV
jgi:hypothetical protein